MSARPALRAVSPTAPRRAIAGIRVSKEREGMTSPENQRYIIEQFAEREGIEIVEWIEGIDESGSRQKSAWWGRLTYACERIEARAADDFIVWRVDRTARNKLKWAVAEERIEATGGFILSATEPNDRSPAGRFGRNILVDHAVFMAESIGSTWKETLERRVRHGLTPNGARHFGYAYSKDDGEYQVDPVEGPVLADMYRAYSAGDSALQIAARLNRPVARPAPGEQYERYSRWNTPAILRLLDSGFGAGYVLFRGELHPGAHEPVITPDEWILYRQARDARRRRPRAERSPYLYSGIIYCHCGSRMGGRTDHGRPRYACTDSATYKAHPDASIAAHVIDAEVMRWLNRIRDRLNKAAREQPRRPRPVADPSKAISRKIAAVTERLDAATIKNLDGTIPDDVYARLRDRFTAELADLDAELTRASAQSTVRPIAFVGDLLAHWNDDLPIERRREALRLLIDRIEVNRPDAERRVTVRSSIIPDE